MKRAELLELKAKQLAERQQQDPALAQQISEIKARVAQYEAARRVADAPAPPKGLVRLGVMKNEKIERIGA